MPGQPPSTRQGPGRAPPKAPVRVPCREQPRAAKPRPRRSRAAECQAGTQPKDRHPAGAAGGVQASGGSGGPAARQLVRGRCWGAQRPEGRAEEGGVRVDQRRKRRRGYT